MIGDLPPNPRRSGDPTPEETERIVKDVLASFEKKHAAPALSNTEQAVVKSKAIHTAIMRSVRGDIGDRIVEIPLWRSRLMDAYRQNFEHHFSHDELIEVLAVLHTEIAIEKLF